eukprot:GEMP01035758.1.p1 GENE.GEMP01035758.1~~GEMP01035758.1.p1  ORF type:complete len:398 (+),score=104.30 GEMP01035758.1:724-1917(+)
MEDNLGAHGTFDVLDILRRDTFDGWWTDYGVIGIFLQLVVADNRAPGATVLDIGGHYSTFLNRTGLVTAFAVDAAGGEDELQRYTGSKVQFFDAQEPVVNSPYASRQFDYILCLEVAEHIKPDKTHIFVRNLDLLGKRGLVLSWAQEESCGLGWGHVNCRNTEDVIFLMEKSTSYRVDLDITAHLRAKSQISWIAKTVLYFSKPQEQHHTTGPVHNQRVAHPESIEPLSILARQQGASTAPSPQVHDMQQKEQPHVPGAGDHGLFSGSASILSSSELRTNGNLFDATSSHRRAGNEGSAPGSASRDDSSGASRVGGASRGGGAPQGHQWDASATHSREKPEESDFDDYVGPDKARLYGRHERHDEFERRIKKSLEEAKVLLHKVVTGMSVPARFNHN